MAHLPPIFSTTSDMEGSLSASMTFTGLPTLTPMERTASMPPLAMVSATRPMSHVTLNALSIAGRSSFVAKASASASRMVMSAAPTLILPVTVLQRYLASSGPESWRRPARVFCLVSWESLPSAFSIVVSPLTTLATVSSSENSAICFFLEIMVSATWPMSPVSMVSFSTLSSGFPEALAMAFMTSLSAMPSTPGTKSGWSFPWLR